MNSEVNTFWKGGRLLLDVDQSQAGKFAVAFGDLAYCTLYALESDLVGLTLREGKELALDKKIYLIRQVSHEDGIVLLTLTARRGY